MTEAVRVVTDSSCDLPRDVLERFRIAVVPLIVRFGTEEHRDGDLSADEYWERAAGPAHPQTSQPPVGVFEEMFARLVERGRRVLCLTVTSRHSGTFSTAQVAAQSFAGAVEVFDSQSLSLGLGLQALAAARAAQAGQSLQEILALVEDLRSRAQLAILLDTLENLRRGGRADGFISVIDRMTRALNVKPIINLVEGQLRLVSAARSFEGGVRRLLNLAGRLSPLEHLAVVHTRRQKKAEEVAEVLAEQTGFAREHIWVRETGPVLATHGGPGVIGVLAIPAAAGQVR